MQEMDKRGVQRLRRRGRRGRGLVENAAKVSGVYIYFLDAEPEGNRFPLSGFQIQ